MKVFPGKMRIDLVLCQILGDVVLVPADVCVDWEIIVNDIAILLVVPVSNMIKTMLFLGTVMQGTWIRLSVHLLHLLH